MAMAPFLCLISIIYTVKPALFALIYSEGRNSMQSKDYVLNNSIELCGITKRYGDKTVVKDVNMTINKGDFVTILGPSGAGKTTVLKMISGFTSISDGKILIDSNDIAKTPANKRNFGMLFQNYALFPHMTVEGNIEYPLKIRKIPKNERKRLVNEMLKIVELEGFNKRYPRQLSGGQQQRVALARALVFKPLVLLLDEPMAALDKQLRKQMQVEIKKIHDRLGLTTVSVTHDQEEALTMANKVCVMRDGKICQISSPEDMYEKPSSTFIANFIGESTILEATATDINGLNLKAKLKYDGRVLDVSLNSECTAPKAGDNCYLIIRPEKVKVVSDDYTGEQFTGSITQSVYAGDMFHITVKTDKGVEFKVKVFSRGKYDLSVGASIRIGFRCNDIVAVTE